MTNRYLRSFVGHDTSIEALPAIVLLLHVMMECLSLDITQGRIGYSK